MLKVPLLHIGIALVVDVVECSIMRDEVGGIVANILSLKSFIDYVSLFNLDEVLEQRIEKLISNI